MRIRDTHALGFGIMVAVTGFLAVAYSSRSAAAESQSPSNKSASSTIGTEPSSTGAKVPKEQKASAASIKPEMSEQAYGAWTLQCLTGTAVLPPCQITHRLTSGDGRQIALVLSMAMIAKDKVALQMALPLGFAIREGVKITFGSNYSTVANVARCTNQGCLVEGDCPPDMIAAMMRSKEGSVSVQTMQGGVIKLAVSLDGFSTAYEAMKAK